MSRRASIAAGNVIEQQLRGELRNNVLVVVNINKKLSCRRDRELLGVIENFAKSLKVIQNDTRANPCVSYRFGDIQR